MILIILCFYKTLVTFITENSLRTLVYYKSDCESGYKYYKSITSKKILQNGGKGNE